MEQSARCPIDHERLSKQRMPFDIDDSHPPVVQDEEGVWHVRNYEIAKQILRSRETRQAGFSAEVVRDLPDAFLQKEPVLFQDGSVHTAQRREISRFFTPKTTQSNYYQMMEAYTDEIIEKLFKAGRMELSDLTMMLAAKVAAEIVGLTNSRLPGMPQRIDRFIQGTDLTELEGNFFGKLADYLRVQINMAKFLYLDVKPAINARRRNPQEDIISHLIAEEYRDMEILVECLTYGTAGMVTTREFIVFAAWHMLEDEGLRTRYLAADERERQLILEEILRLEPIVGHLFRRAAAEIKISDEFTIPAGALIDLHIYAVNQNVEVVGDNPAAVCPARELPRGVQPPVMSFGEGHHRCPGAHVAIQETDIFLRRFLTIPNLKLVSEPHINYKATIAGYETRNFIVSVEA
ncbi:MAG: cytochrome P450 [Chloroflexota bacterium]